MTKHIDLDALQALAEKATPGPWRVDGDEIGPVSREDDQTFGMVLPIADVYGDNRDENLAFIAAANPQTILSLIARIRELEGDTGKSAEAWQPIETEARKKEFVFVQTEPPGLREYWDCAGGVYAGIKRGNGSEPDYHLVIRKVIVAPSAGRAAPDAPTTEKS